MTGELKSLVGFLDAICKAKYYYNVFANFEINTNKFYIFVVSLANYCNVLKLGTLVYDTVYTVMNDSLFVLVLEPCRLKLGINCALQITKFSYSDPKITSSSFK